MKQSLAEPSKMYSPSHTEQIWFRMKLKISLEILVYDVKWEISIAD